MFVFFRGYASTNGPAFPLHSDIIMPYFSKYGSEEQKQKYIPDMTAGKKISAIAMTEPDAGRYKDIFFLFHWAFPFLIIILLFRNESDLQGIKSFARKDGSDYILNGSKIFISNGWLADVVVVVAVTNKEAKSAAHGISLFLVDADTPGFKKSWLMKKIGLGASVSLFFKLLHHVCISSNFIWNQKDTAGLFFEDVRLPASALLGEENKGFYYLMNELPQERLTIGVHACAHSEFMFEETKQYVMQRKAYGKTLSNLQVHGHTLSFTHLECATLYNLTFYTDDST